VGCDHSAFARDAALLVAAGLELVRLVVVDLFPGTSHVETVGAFVRA
jgi:tRNA/tmRNA/rRNA uracil-C5-methylase (TrmA/RlmC/RlmD family)